MKREELMLAQLDEVFTQRKPSFRFTNCMDVRHQTLSHVVEVDIIDENNRKIKRSTYQTNDSQQVASFRLENPTQKQIYLIAVDGCCFGSSDPSHCDCIVFDDTYFCFVELKLDERNSNSEVRKPKMHAVSWGQ